MAAVLIPIRLKGWLCSTLGHFFPILGYTHTDGFRVFKLEHDDNGARWIQVTNLGNRILFLSMASSLLVPSAIGRLDYYGPCGKTLETNRIYFAFEGGHDLGTCIFLHGWELLWLYISFSQGSLFY